MAAPRFVNPLLKQLHMRGSGVDVTKGYPSAAETNQLSLFEVLSLEENQPKHRVHHPSYQKLTHFIGQTNPLHVEALEQVVDFPSELGVREVERVFGVSFQVYLLESFEGALRTVLVRPCGRKDKVIHVVFISGRYLRIRDLAQFQRFVTSHAPDDPPRLQWIKKHRHIRTLMKNQKGQA